MEIYCLRSFVPFGKQYYASNLSTLRRLASRKHKIIIEKVRTESTVTTNISHFREGQLLLSHTGRAEVISSTTFAKLKDEDMNHLFDLRTLIFSAKGYYFASKHSYKPVLVETKDPSKNRELSRIGKMNCLDLSDNMGHSSCFYGQYLYYAATCDVGEERWVVVKVDILDPKSEEQIVCKSIEDFIVNQKGELITITRKGVIKNHSTEATSKIQTAGDISHLKSQYGLIIANSYEGKTKTNTLILINKHLKEVCRLEMQFTGAITRTILFSKPLKNYHDVTMLWVPNKNCSIDICLTNGRQLVAATSKSEITIAGADQAIFSFLFINQNKILVSGFNLELTTVEFIL